MELSGSWLASGCPPLHAEGAGVANQEIDHEHSAQPGESHPLTEGELAR